VRPIQHDQVARSAAGQTRRGVIVAALVTVCVLAGGVVYAAVAMPFSDGFDRANGSLGDPWSNTNGWAVEDGRVRLLSNGIAEAVVDSGLSDRYRVSATIAFSPNRANAGLTTLWKNHANHLFCKIEVTPGNPSGLISIGHALNGKGKSLLKSAKGFGLSRGGTYQLSITKLGKAVSCAVTGSGIGGGTKTITYTLSSSEVSSFGSATRSGLRGKNLYDEDDGLTRYDAFSVQAI
jgi:hypothetical protein